jgi:transposase
MGKAIPVIADKGYDSKQLRSFIHKKGSASNIPRKSNSIQGNQSMD